MFCERGPDTLLRPVREVKATARNQQHSLEAVPSVAFATEQ